MTTSDQVEELKKLFPNVNYAEEGGYRYFLIQNLALPEHCAPKSVDVLLCPDLRDGYHSRLYFAEQVNSGKSLNWHVQGIRILERNWFAFSWQLPTGLRMAQMLTSHLRGLTC